jgi:hypothetical protein
LLTVFYTLLEPPPVLLHLPSSELLASSLIVA